MRIFRSFPALSAAAALIAAGCAANRDAGAPMADPPAASGGDALAGVADGSYKAYDDKNNCAYMQVSGGQPTGYQWDLGCNGSHDFIARQANLKMEGDTIYTTWQRTTRYEKIHASGDGFDAIQEFRGRRYPVEFRPDDGS